MNVAAGAAAVSAICAGRLLGPAVLPHAVTAPRRTFASAAAGRISYYVQTATSGVPAILLHGLGPHGSAFELRGLYEELRRDRPVVVVDLPGYGLSERRPRAATRDELVAALSELVDELARTLRAPVDLVAAGRTGEIAAAVAARSSRVVRSVAILGPQHLCLTPPARRRTSRALRLFRRGLEADVVARVVHRVVTTRPALSLVFGRRVAGKVDPKLVRYVSAASRLPLAPVAAVAALTGSVTRGDVDETYAPLSIPLCFVRGEKDTSEVLAVDALVADHPWFRSAVVPGARCLPHVERPDDTAAELRAFWTALVPKPQLRLIRGARYTPRLRGSPRRGASVR